MLGVFQTRQLNNLKAGGLVGMAPSAADYRIPLFMDMMKDMGAIKEKVFGFYLTNNMYSEEPEGSILTIGGYDLTKYAKANQTVRWHKLID